MGVEQLLFSSLIVFAAGLVRGFSGFGFSLLAVTALSLILPPSQTVPTLLMLELAASIHLLPMIWREVDWRSIFWLVLGAIPGTPFGSYALAQVPVKPLQIALALAVAVSALFLLKGFRMTKYPSRTGILATGFLSGALNGAFGIAGPPVILFFFSGPAGATVARASLIAYFVGADFVSLASAGANGLITRQGLIQFLIWLPTMMIAVWLGARAFKGVDPAVFRRWVLFLLLGLACLTGAKALSLF